MTKTETTLDKQRRSKMETKLDEINRDDARQQETLKNGDEAR